MVRTSLSLMVALMLLVGSSAQAARVRFESGKLANFFWIMDQVSQWDPGQTDPAYRSYWADKLGGLSTVDQTVLSSYAEFRQRFALAQKVEEGSASLRVFPSTETSSQSRFVSAFLTSQNLAQVEGTLGLSSSDAQVLDAAMAHFASRISPMWSEETRPLDQFVETANALADISQPGDYVETVRRFLGAPALADDMVRVHVLWAPPGGSMARHFGLQILLPVPGESAGSDLMVLQLTGDAVGEICGGLVQSLPSQTREEAGGRLLSQVGFVDAMKPSAVAEALSKALGVLFLKRSFPDLKAGRVFYPYDSSLERPHAIDELVRQFVPVLDDLVGQESAFYPKFIDRAVEVQRTLFPPTPRQFMQTALVLTDDDGAYFFGSLFRSVDRKLFGVGDVKGFLDAARKEPQRLLVIVVKPENEGAMWEALKALDSWKELSQGLKKFQGKSVIFPVSRAGKAPVIVIRSLSVQGIRTAALELYNASAMLAQPKPLE